MGPAKLTIIKVAPITPTTDSNQLKVGAFSIE
jgi:hypothetical protein